MSGLLRKLTLSLPMGKKIWVVLCLAKNIFFNENSLGKVGFFGWDMYTPHDLPWHGEDKISRNFNQVHSNFLELINQKKFKLSQFYENKNEQIYIINNLKWRHYNIFWSVKYAIHDMNAQAHGLNKQLIQKSATMQDIPLQKDIESKEDSSLLQELEKFVELL